MNEEYSKLFKSLWLILRTMSVSELNFFIEMPEDDSFTKYVILPDDILPDWRIRNFQMSEKNKELFAKFLNEQLSEKLPSLWRKIRFVGTLNNVQFNITITKDRELLVVFNYNYYDSEDSEDEYSVEDDPKLSKVFESILAVNPDILSAEFEFEGSGDSGAIDPDMVTNEGTFPIPEPVARWSYSVLPYGFEINEGSNGSFLFNVEDQEVTVTIRENIEGSHEDTMLELKF